MYELLGRLRGWGGVDPRPPRRRRRRRPVAPLQVKDDGLSPTIEAVFDQLLTDLDDLVLDFNRGVVRAPLRHPRPRPPTGPPPRVPLCPRAGVDPPPKPRPPRGPRRVAPTAPFVASPATKPPAHRNTHP